MKRTRAVEILTEAGISFELGEFDASQFTAEEVAEKLRIPLASVFKTLVARSDKSGEVFALVPGDKELNLKRLATVLGGKRCDLVRVEELQRLTGYLKGGVSPIGAKRALPVYLDQSALCQNRLSISAGLRGLQLLIAPDEFLRATNATIADLC